MNLICQFWQIKKKLSKQISADDSQKKRSGSFLVPSISHYVFVRYK